MENCHQWEDVRRKRCTCLLLELILAPIVTDPYHHVQFKHSPSRYILFVGSQ